MCFELEVCEAGFDGARGNATAFLPACSSDGPGQAVSGTGAIDDDESSPAFLQLIAAGFESLPQALAVVGGAPSGERVRPDRVDADAGAGFDQPLHRGGASNRLVEVHKPGALHPCDDVQPALVRQLLSDCARMRRRCRWQPELVAHEEADFGPAHVVVRQVDDLPVRAHEAVDAVLVVPPMLVVLSPDVSVPAHAELGLEGPPPQRQDRLRIGMLRRRVDMQMITGPLCRVATSAGDQLPKLKVQVAASDDAPRFDDANLFVLMRFQEMS